jgi:hypothetical protein
VVLNAVSFSTSATAPAEPHTRFAIISRHFGLPHFLSRNPVIYSCVLRKVPVKEEQDICPGNDKSEDAPLGYFVIKGDSIDVNVICQ